VLPRRVLPSIFEGFAWQVGQYSPQFSKDYPWRVLPWVFPIPCSVATPSATTMPIESIPYFASTFYSVYLLCISYLHAVPDFPLQLWKGGVGHVAGYCLVALRKFFPPGERTSITWWKVPDFLKQCLTCHSCSSLVRLLTTCCGLKASPSGHPTAMSSISRLRNRGHPQVFSNLLAAPHPSA